MNSNLENESDKMRSRGSEPKSNLSKALVFDESLLIGKIFESRYMLEKLLGVGSFSRVYLVNDDILKIKLIFIL